MFPVRTQAPSGAVVSLDEVKEQLHIDFNDDDVHIASLIQAATDHFDGYGGVLGRCLVSQNWSIALEGWPTEPLLLPFPEISSLTISYLDGDAVEQTLSAAAFQIVRRGEGDFVCFRNSFDRPELSTEDFAPISIEMTAGFGSANEVPHPIKVAVMMLVAHWYENRGALSGGASPMPFGVDAMVAPYRRATV